MGFSLSRGPHQTQASAGQLQYQTSETSCCLELYWKHPSSYLPPLEDTGIVGAMVSIDPAPWGTGTKWGSVGGAASPRSGEGEAAPGAGRWDQAAVRKTPSSGSRSLEGKHPQPRGSVPHRGTQDQPPLFPLLPLPGCRAAVFSLRSVRL